MLTTLPALCRVSLISLAYFLCEKDGVEEIVWPRPPRDDPVTLTQEMSHQLCRVGLPGTIQGTIGECTDKNIKVYISGKKSYRSKGDP